MTTLLYPREVAREWVPVVSGAQQPCLLRDATGRQHLYRPNASGHLVVRRWDDDDANPEDITIDESAGCAWPHFQALPTGMIEGAYMRGTAPKLARSRNLGRTWSIATIPGTYTATTSVVNQHMRVLLGYRSGEWYIRTGLLGDDGSAYSWSVELSTGIETSNGVGHLMARKDGALEFTYRDSAGAWQIVRCRKLTSAGVGTWG